MDSHTLLTVWLLSFLGLCSSQSNNVLEGPLNKAVGENATFKLTTPPSTPPEHINWDFKRDGETIKIIAGAQINPDYSDRVSVDKSTASLELRNLSFNDTGEYILSFSLNFEKGRTSLTVHERISGANITTLPDNLIAGRSSVSLTCNATQGTSITREWTKDGNPLSTSNTVTISADNRTVSISPVEKHDNGEYMCKLSNLISNMEVKRTLIVNYGPEKPHIEGKGVVEFGHKITLTCSAESIPESSYTWAINGTNTSVTGASYIKEQSEHKDSGIYTCTALNHITGKTTTTDFEMSITAKGSIGVNNGAIVGIVIAFIIILASVIGLTIFLLKKKRKPDAPKPHQARDQSNGPVELNYADISQFQRKDGQTVNLGNSGAGQTVYSGVRPNSGPSSSQGPTCADLQFPNKGFGLGAPAGNRGNTGDQNTEYAVVRPKGQAPRPPIRYQM